MTKAKITSGSQSEASLVDRDESIPSNPPSGKLDIDYENVAV